LTAQLRARIEEAFPRVWVEGELADCRSWQSGHVYFTLKDGDAQLQGVMFRTDAVRLKFAPAPGLHVLVRGRLTVYPTKGQYQLVADAMEPRGAGALQLALEQIKRRLQADGLFDLARKRPLPMLPRRVGLVTSLDGAALRDMLRVLRTRRAPVDIVVSPARVQGDGAAADLARALRRVCAVDDVDVVIIGRGGGSAEDLWAFNDEHLARAIAACPVPVVSAVGHEIDTTMADFVADVRAATPSQAAEFVVRQATEFSDRLAAIGRHLMLGLRSRLERRRVALLRLEQRPAFAHFRDGLATRDRARQEAAVALVAAWRTSSDRRRRHLTDLEARLSAQHPRTRFHARLRRLVAADSLLRDAGTEVLARAARGIGHLDTRLDATSPARRLPSLQRHVDERTHRLAAAAAALRHAADARVRQLAGRLENLSPLRTLARGYAVCWDETHTSPVRSSAGVPVGTSVHVQLADGELQCRVEAARPPALDDR
jgi:exodeoxyribonuclease VII large subunit